MVNVYFNYYSDSDYKRAFEIDSCLHMLTENKAIDKLYVLYENPDEIPNNSSNCIPIQLSKRPTFSNIITIISSKSEEDDINIFMNSDCFILEDGIEKIKSMAENEAYCLSRREIKSAKPLRVQKLKTRKLWKKNNDMQDLWCFRGIPKSGMSLDFYMGKPGCDNRLAYEMENAGYTIKNPRTKVAVYHFHTTQLRRYNEIDRIAEPYSFPTVE